MPASCSRTPEASRRSAPFSLPCPLLVAAAAFPSNAVVKVGSTPITKETFGHWLPVAAASSADDRRPPRPSRWCPSRRTTRPASRTSKRQRPNRPRASPSRRRRSKVAVRTGVHALKQQVLGFLISANWVIGEASDQGVKVSDAEVQKNSKKSRPSSSPRPPNSRNSSPPSGQTVSDLLLRVKLNLLSRRSSRRSQKRGRRHQRADRKVLQGKQVALRHAGKARPEDHPHQDAGAGRSREEGNRIGQELRERRQEASRSTPPARATAECSWASQGRGAEGARQRDLRRQAERPQRPNQDPLRLLHLRSESRHAPHQQSLAQAKSTIKQQLTATQQQAALTKFVKNSKRSGRARPNAARNTRCRTARATKPPRRSTTPRRAHGHRHAADGHGAHEHRTARDDRPAK